MAKKYNDSMYNRILQGEATYKDANKFRLLVGISIGLGLFVFGLILVIMMGA